MTIPPTCIPAFDTAEVADETVKGQIRQANEALVLAAAERVFARARAWAGFGGATMAAIAEASGRPKANLHHCFGSKQALYRRVLGRTLDDWLVPTHCITPQADLRMALILRGCVLP